MSNLTFTKCGHAMAMGQLECGQCAANASRAADESAELASEVFTGQEVAERITDTTYPVFVVTMGDLVVNVVVSRQHARDTLRRESCNLYSITWTGGEMVIQPETVLSQHSSRQSRREHRTGTAMDNANVCDDCGGSLRDSGYRLPPDENGWEEVVYVCNDCGK
jgi:hypothetical protein